MFASNKRGLLALCAVLSAGGLSAIPTLALAQAPAKAADEIVIGVIEDRSGSASFYSQESVKSLKLYVEEINKGKLAFATQVAGSAPGILGKPVKTLFEDDENNSNLTVVKARRLLERGANVLFFLSGSGATMQGRVVCTEQKVLCIAPTNVSSRLVQAPNDDYIFTIAPQSELSGKAYTDAWAKLGVKKIAVVSDSSATSRVVKDAYRKTWEAAGFTTVADELMEIGATDANSQVLRVKQQLPDIVFDAVASASESAALYKGLARQGMTGQRWAQNNVTATPKIWQLSGDAINGVVVVDPIGPNNPNTNQIRKVYEDKYGAQTFVWLHAVVWDGLALLKTAANTAKSADGTALRDAMEKISNFPSGFGQAGNTLSFAKGKHNGTTEKGLVIVQFASQKPSVLWTTYQPAQ